MRRLYWQIYLTFIGILVLFGVLVSLAFWMAHHRDRRGLEALAAVAEEILPPPNEPPTEVSRVLERLAREFHISSTVWAPTGAPVASVGDPLPRPEMSWAGSRILPSRGEGFTLALLLSDGRWVVVRHGRAVRDSAGVVSVLLLLSVAVAVGTYPLVRRLTGRLERLQGQVETWGGGELSARVRVEGQDEVAELAASFNRAAERIETLMSSQKMLLAGASHELRSPLTRIRLGLELLDEHAPPELRERIASDIEELDALLSELLLVSRLDTAPNAEAEPTGPVDLLSLAKEEASGFGASVSGGRVMLQGSERLLRRMLRNLLSNAKRYGRPPVEVFVEEVAMGRVRVTVADGGDGIPAEERIRVFEPFYRGVRPRIDDGTDGVGLGLALVARIARRHGGEARVTGPPSGPSAIVIELQSSPSLDEHKKKAGRG